MVDYHANIVSLLSSILPTYYENNLSRTECAIPCISYMERNSYVDKNGDNLGYSKVSYQIKIWSNSISTIQSYAILIDDTLRQEGWKRTSSQELFDRESTMIQKIMVYEALFYEDYSAPVPSSANTITNE